jgi:MFS family permease
MAYMELVPRFKCSYPESPETVFSCVEQDFCGSDGKINYWIDWDNPMSLHNWSENISLICRPGWQIGMLGSVLFGGWVMTLLWLPSYSDTYGRANLYRIAMIATTIAYGLILISKSFLLTLACAFITGVFTSIRLGVGWPYLLELVHKGSHPVHSMSLLSVCAFQQIICVAYFKYYSNNAYLFMGVGFGIQVVVLVLTFLMPESPVFLLTKGRMVEAEAALARIAKINGKPLQFNPNDFSDWNKQELCTSFIESPVCVSPNRSFGSTSPRVRARSQRSDRFTARYFLKQKKI